MEAHARPTGPHAHSLPSLPSVAMIGRALNPANQLSKRKRARRHHPSRTNADSRTGTLKEGGIVGKVGGRSDAARLRRS